MGNIEHDADDAMAALNVLPPSIEPHATGHIIEQEQLVKQILDNGFAYESNGSIYFDVKKYNEKHRYGILSGRNLDDVKDASRNLAGVGEKRNQAVASQGDQMVHYWMHNNMITINGQKMGKSLGNFITLEQFFKGSHESLDKPYSPMTIRFFILSAHYRGTVDFSNEALQASEKGLEKLMNGIADISRITASAESDAQTKAVVSDLRQKCYDAMNDDFSTPQVISYLFEACAVINKLTDHKATISADDLKELTDTIHLFAFDLLGLKAENAAGNEAREKAFGKVVDMVLELRAKAKADKDWATSDRIRDELAAAGFEVKDTKDGVTWKL
jgi:cysteinyl-tRNA synthetase